MKLKLPNAVQKIVSAAEKNSPTILMAIGVAGFVTTVGLAISATPKAMQLLEEEKHVRIENDEPEMTKIDIVKTTWKCYIPTAISGAMSIACVIGSNSKNAKRNAVLASAYKMSETALIEYQNKVIELIGEKKEKTVRDSIAKDHVEKNPVKSSQVIITGNGKTLCYDDISGRYFESDIEEIRRAENILNKKMMNDMYVSLNEFYDEVNMPHTSLGDELGWNMDWGLIEFAFSSTIAEDGRPCLVVKYRIAPKYGYRNLF